MCRSRVNPRSVRLLRMRSVGLRSIRPIRLVSWNRSTKITDSVARIERSEIRVDFPGSRCAISGVQAKARKHEGPSPDHHGHAPHDRRHASISRPRPASASWRRAAMRSTPGVAARHRARRRAAGIRERRRALRRSSSIPPPRIASSPSRASAPGRRRLTRDYFQKHHGGKIPQGVLRTVVPAAPDAWITALERFGTMSFGEVAQSAIGFARDGFPVYPLMSEIITEHEAEYRAVSVERRALSAEGPPAAAGRGLRADGARRHAAAHGGPGGRGAPRGREAGLAAARDAFYRGRHRARDRQVSEGERRHSCRPKISRTIAPASTSRSRPRSATSGSMPAARGARGRRCCRRSTCSMAARAAQARPQLRRLPAPHHRGGEARLCRPRGLFRRSAHRRRADRGDCCRATMRRSAAR